MKDIVVQLDAGPGHGQRLRAAVALARRFEARLTGLFAQTDSDGPARVARRASQHLKAAADAVAREFAEATSAAGLAAEWQQLPHGEPGFVVEETIFCTRYADLVVLGQTEAEGAKVPEELVEQVVLQAGRPVLIIPQAGPAPALGGRIAVAWNAGREASRALHDALPLLAGADQVHLLTIRRETASMPGDLPKVDMAAHLGRWGVAATAQRVIEADVKVMDALLLQCYELGADLLVMGAHSGLGILRGSGTRHMLRNMTIPVLMSC